MKTEPQVFRITLDTTFGDLCYYRLQHILGKAIIEQVTDPVVREHVKRLQNNYRITKETFQ